jgi:hypothetical protein
VVLIDRSFWFRRMGAAIIAMPKRTMPEACNKAFNKAADTSTDTAR